MGAYDTPVKPCPYCGEMMDADWVDVGVGMVQCGPYHCFSCGGSEIGPEWEKVKHTLSSEEYDSGFYKGRISPHANQHNGVPICHKTAEVLYRAKYFAENENPLNAPILKNLEIIF